jgi:hypothetical protein
LVQGLQRLRVRHIEDVAFSSSLSMSGLTCIYARHLSAPDRRWIADVAETSGSGAATCDGLR